MSLELARLGGGGRCEVGVVLTLEEGAKCPAFGGEWERFWKMKHTPDSDLSLGVSIFESL